MPVAPGVSQGSSDYFDDDDSGFLEALSTAILPGDIVVDAVENDNMIEDSSTSQELEPPPPAQPTKIADDGDFEYSATSQELEPPPPAQPLKRKRSLTPLQETTPPDDIYGDSVQVGLEDEIYGAATFGGFGEYMRRKRAKLQIQNAQILSADAHEGREGVISQIFKGLAIYINGHTRPSVQDLRQLIVQHGGIFQPYLDKKALVTHIITCSLTPAKIREFKHMKVVRPEWLVESVEKGCLLPWRNYIYVHEERIEQTQGAKSNQVTLVDRNRDVASSSSGILNQAHGTSLANKPSSTKPTLNLLLGKKLPPADPLYTSDPKTKAEAARVPGYAVDQSNPNAQRAMANPEWRKANTSISSGFIEGYYKNSRLHHLATWKSELKDLVQEAQERAETGVSGHVGKVDSEARSIAADGAGGVSMRGAELVLKSPSSKFKGKAKALEDQERVIMHCDFDCFFVSAGLVSRPELKGKPVVVCHSQGGQGGASSTSEIASSSYEARKFGVKNGMNLQQARQLCPDIITIPYEFERYKQFSLLFYTVLMSHADDLQAVSVDEALIDVTTAVNQLRAQAQRESALPDPAKDFAEKIRAEVRKATTCEVSIGISHNILLARLATRRAKPGGSFHLSLCDVPEFLAPLDISDLHGFGWSTKQKAREKLGATNLGELAKKSKAALMDALGKGTGETLYNAVRGIDEKKLESDKPRKSVSCEINYGIRFENNEQAEAFIQQMAVEIKRRLDAIGMVGRSITLKIMKRDPTAPVEPFKFLGHGPCDLFNKQMPLIAPGGKATSDDQIIGEHAWRLLKSLKFDPRELRGIGIQVQKLESSSSSIHAPPAQAVLPFRSKVGSSKDVPPEPQINVIPSPPLEGATITGDPVKPSTVNFDLPSFSQVDRSVLEALPRDVREEIEKEYKRRSASPFVSGAPPVAPNNKPADWMPGPFGKRSSTPSFFPKPNHKGPNVKRITQQLAPRSRASISPHKSALHQWALKLAEKEKKKSIGVRITDAALLDLKLDPEVFRVLPTKVQREQLIMARIIKEKGRLPEPPKERKVLKPKKHVLPPDFVPYRAPKPKARYLPKPFLRQQGKTKKEKLYFTETDDIQRIVETWMDTYRHWVPKEKDVEFLAKFIVQSVDRAQASDVGVERAVAVMKWWIVLLRRHFPASEIMEEEDLALSASQRNLVGEAWWGALHGIQDQMDAITRKRFGGRLSLR
ncbi:hypothetical protein M413DRAFT_15584 [Hebeloma cylindrosporum]|uniref:DNA repair protein REV1 n=1 Tax=Hebeloma cylindrosporum TaxID=76867 RepID=A0A0C3CZJ6_HEBCY|nr:hypothetical protein M413DRAFT_15584 [Hebeloma cylindrosporum h7]